MDDYNKLNLDASYRVTLHKNLIEAEFSKSLTLVEQRLLFAAISNIPAPIFKMVDGKKVITNPVTELPKFKMSVKEFSDLLGWKEVDYKKLQKVAVELMSKVITTKSVDKNYPQLLQWVSNALYVPGTGTVLVTLNKDLLPFVANLTENFASVSLGEITSFKSKYSARLFFLLKQWEKVGQKTLTLDEIRKIIGVGFTVKGGKRVYKLDKFFHFNQRALTPAIEEINEYTDLKISYDEIKEGQKIVALNFHIEKKKTKPEPKKETPKPKPEPKEKPQTIYDEIAQTIPNLQKSAYTNIAKHLKEIENIEAIKDSVIMELNKLASYIGKSESIKSNEGFAISEVEKAVLQYQMTNNFNFNELLNGFKSQGRTELVPDWFDNRNEEKTRVIPHDELDYEAEKAKILAKLQVNAE